jgi:hypothetical protein
MAQKRNKGVAANKVKSEPQYFYVCILKQNSLIYMHYKFHFIS